MSSHSNFLFLFLALLPLSSIAQTSHNISLGTSHSTADENAPWVLSTNGDFGFGFYRLLNKDLFLLAIWYAKIPQKTVIWSANGDNPVQKGSKVELTIDGELVLNDHQGQEIWRPGPQAINASNGRVTSAAMLDTGNFVLKGSLNTSYFWQTFNEPTDTILPTQVLEWSGKLSSRLTESSFSNGRFQLRLLNDGNLVLNTIGFPTERANDAYYVSNTYGSGFRVLFNESGYISILRRDGGTPLNITQTSTGSPMDFYYRATLDFDGVFRQYRYPKTKQRNGETAEIWSIISSIPRLTDICLVAPSKEGSGICGFNSYCRVGNNEERHTCECPDGYSFFDPSDKYKGCKQNHAVELRQACDLDKQRVRDMFEMTPLSNIDWPLSDSELLTPYDEAQCSIACLEDCLCAVAITRNKDCWKKKLPLSNGRMDTSLGGKALIKVLKQDSTQAGKRKKDQGSLILAGSFLLGCSAFLNFLFLLGIPLSIYFSFHKKLLKAQPDASMLAMNLRPSLISKGRQIGLCGKEINRMGCSDPDLSTVRSTSVELDVSAFVCTVTPLVWSGSQSQRCYC
ncbi:hypothetical protein MRB53_012371 [Persea americana]|uniref:Uncharacterized protein n=1 Tax=Persea americana TaxID=3435 RepID=A0ACC2LXR5_PERAE|nr:hypothetical protein MRB53_012371 [Persea americana]